jgi:hypothetical protein
MVYSQKYLEIIYNKSIKKKDTVIQYMKQVQKKQTHAKNQQSQQEASHELVLYLIVKLACIIR